MGSCSGEDMQTSSRETIDEIILSSRGPQGRGDLHLTPSSRAQRSNLASNWRLLRHSVPRNDGKEFLARLRRFATRNDKETAPRNDRRKTEGPQIVAGLR